ncbi:uncharacterized protein M421DRAFT_302679 [Didymella exigua CBS 183.55]|uniref:Uncharacterized protein n=1 Tax=Didymella exigua CBS 183.55 TaxID=1150837 RepID=A0A6A5R8L8_9PLEO|nr:uncharacterized protein M421DRAFT_302679 [Didymella exigua CBS 183.55]KAF1923973.1 hypothetical protein M421DRAFT_302679 [Didymella exigua CBS 183.55]
MSGHARLKERCARLGPRVEAHAGTVARHPDVQSRWPNFPSAKQDYLQKLPNVQRTVRLTALQNMETEDALAIALLARTLSSWVDGCFNMHVLRHAIQSGRLVGMNEFTPTKPPWASWLRPLRPSGRCSRNRVATYPFNREDLRDRRYPEAGRTRLSHFL